MNDACYAKENHLNTNTTMNHHPTPTPNSTVLMRAARMSVVLVALAIISGTVLVFA